MKKVIGCISLVLLGLVAMLAGLVVTETRPCGRLDGFLADSGCIRMLEPDTEQIYQIAFSPDGTTLAVLAFNNTVQLWRVSDGTLARTLGDYKNETIWDMSFTPNGEFMAIGLWGAVQFWRVSDGTLVHTLKVSETDNLTFSPDGNILAAGSHTIELWQISDGTLLHTLKQDFNRVENLAFSPDRTTLASGGVDGVVQLWRTSDGSPLYTIKHRSPLFDPWGGWIRNVAFSPDGTILATNQRFSGVRFFDIHHFDNIALERRPNNHFKLTALVRRL